jgi:hypothetical protein
VISISIVIAILIYNNRLVSISIAVAVLIYDDRFMVAIPVTVISPDCYATRANRSRPLLRRQVLRRNPATAAITIESLRSINATLAPALAGVKEFRATSSSIPDGARLQELFDIVRSANFRVIELSAWRCLSDLVRFCS